MTLNFMVHCGGKEVERAAIEGVLVPQQTETYCPVPHGDLVNLIEDRLGNVGFVFGEQAHALNKEGNQYFGMAELKGQTSGCEAWNLVAGWRSSYDRSLSANFVVGSQVFVCDNLAFSGEIQIGRKHTPNIIRDLPDLITDAVGRTRGMSEKQLIRYEGYQGAKMKDKDASHAVIQLLKAGVFPSQHVEKVINEYHEPSHREHLDDAGNKTIWTLFNAVTETIKGCNIATLPKRTITLHNHMDEVLKLAA